VPRRSLAISLAELDPGLTSLRAAAVTMTATLASFGTALLIEHVARLSTSIVVLAVALTLSLGRTGPRAGQPRGPRGWVLAAVVLPLVAVGASEIGSRFLQQPDLGDALFVLAMSATIWLRRFGATAREIARLATFPLVAMLIVPAPIVTADGSAGDGRVWAALVAVLALGWVTVCRWAAGRAGVLAPDPATATETAPGQPAAATSRRLASSTKMALQMAVALGAAFAAGRILFGAHWPWAVLTAFIVCSGNRGRGDVLHKAAMRLAGAGAGTLAATALSGVFPGGDRWSVVAIFAVLAVALWLRPRNYAYWAAGMTAALALLYGYYGQRGIGLLGDRIEAIFIGAALAAAASWLVLPVRTTDVLRRDVATALAALDDYLAALARDADSAAGRPDRFRHAVATLAQTATPLRWLPRRLRAGVDHLPAVAALERCAALLPSVSLAWQDPARPRLDGPARLARLEQVRTGLGDLRRANARQLPPEPGAWSQLPDAVGDLSRTVDAPAPDPPGRSRGSTEKILSYVNRVHAANYKLVSALDQDPVWPAYLVADASGGQARLTWSRDTTAQSPASRTERGELAAGRTPSGYPYRLLTWPPVHQSGESAGQLTAEDQPHPRGALPR
jgi:Fusaric acid resistance protein family